VGIAGDEYFEVVEGLQPGDSIVAGSYQAIRDLKDSTRVKNTAPASDSAKGGHPS
jgi:HlyD family secretion protein